jgi:hypothetical protein
MGAELAAFPDRKRPCLRIVCEGANGLDHVRIVRNGTVLHTIPCHGEASCALEWEDPEYANAHPHYYDVRVVQVDRESAWSSPIWIG